MSSLKRQAESLCGREDLDKQTRLSLVQDLKSLEEEWKEVLQNAQELNSLLRSVVERLVSCQCQRQQTQSRVEQLKQQIAALPRRFPWPGLGDRRHALEQATALLDKVRSLRTTLSALRALGREMSQLTRDPSWTDPSWTAMEECVPGLIKDLMELSESLEEGICTERNCAQLVEQHSAAQDWLREQVKGFGSLPTDRYGLQGSINTLKALLQTVKREEREMRELDMAKEALINLCTTGGRDALTLETGHLHDLRAASEREINERLIVCETRLADIELKIAERAESFRAQAESILNDLRAQECLGFVEGIKKISQVEENSKILKTCEKELEKIECQVRALQQAVCTVPPDEALPPNVNSLVNTVTQQYCRQQTKLSERKDDCADSVMRCMRNALQALRSWTQSTQTQAFSDSVCTVQAMIEEGAELHENLQEAVSHKQLLRDCLGRELTDKLERDASNALKEADTLINQLQQTLQDLEEERRKSKALTMSAETRTSHSVSEVSCEWPRKPDTSIKVELNLSKPQDILPAPAGSSKGPAVETFEEVRRDVAVSTTEETPAKSERPLETLAGDDFLADNPSEAMLTMALGQKSGDGEVSMTVNKELLPESPTEEQPPLFAVDERAAEFGKDDPPTTTPATTSKQEQLTDVAASESLSHQADVLEFDTERIKPSKSLEEREFQLNTPVPTATDADLIEEISDDVDFPTPDRSLTALRIDRDKPKTVPFSTTALAVQSDKVQEPDVCAVDPGKSEGEIEMEMKIRMQELRDAETSLERKVEESSGHDGCRTYAQSLEQKSDAVEEANRNWSLTSDTFDLLPEEGKMPKKKIAALILDTDTVHIHSTEVPGMTDPNSGKMYLSSHTGCDGALSHRIGTSDTSDEARKQFDGHTSPDQQEREIVTDVIDSTNSSQPSEGNIDRTETQISNATNYEREGTRTTNNGPQEVQRGVEPLEHWTVNNGPQEIQRRYMILERNGGLEVRQEPAAETNVPALDTATSKTGGRGTGDSELEVMENIEQVVGKESAATEDSERVTWNAKKQSETLEIMGVPARRKLDGLPCSCEDKLVQDVDKVIVEFESAKSTTVKGETEPTPPARRSKATESLSVSSDVRCEEAPLPVPTIHRYELEEIQLPPEGILHPPPDRTHKETVVVERLSLVLDSTTTPERRRKERAGYQQPEPEKSSETVVVEEPLIKPTPPLRQKVSQIESDGTSVVSKRQKMEETPVKPTPPTRRRDSGVVTDLVSDSGDLDKARTKEIAVEERVDKTTPAVRRKSIQDEREFITPLVSMPRGTEDLLVKPTPPTRRKDSRCVRDTVSKETASENPQSTELEKAVMQGIAGEEKPTPTVRRKGSLLSQIQKMEDTSVKPTPPERRRASRNFSDEAYEEMARKISTSTDLEKIPTQENTLEEPFIKPTPPVRRKVSSQIESDAFSVLSKIHEAAEMVVKPTPPTRRRDSRNISDIVTIKCSSSTDLVTQDKPLLKPTPPMRRKSQETEATLWKPTPPVRRRNSGNMTDTSASRLYGSCDLEDSVLVTPERGVGEALVKPTPPFRRKTLSRTGSDISIVEKSKEMEEASVKPTPPTRRRDSRNVSDKVAMDLQNSVTQEKNLKGFTMKPVPTTRQKTTPAESDPSVVSETQETEATLLKPTPPTRRRESTDMSDTVAGTISSSYDLENISEVRVIKPTPSLRKAIEDESDDIISVVLMPQEIDKTLGELTPPTRRRESNNLSDVAAGEISVSSDLETFGTQDRAAEEALVKPSPPEETLVKPILLTHGQDSRTMGEIVPNQAEGEFSSIHLDKTAAEEEIMVIQTPPGLQAQSDLSTIAKTQEMEGKLKKPITPTRRRDSISVDETVPKQMESNIFVNVLDETFRPESADEADLPIQTQLVVQDASQAESDVSVIDKTQKMVEILGKPISPTRRIESRTVDENVNVQMEREISSSIDLDNTVRPASAVEEDLVKLVEQEGIQAESDKSIIENKQEVEEKLEESTSLTSRGHSRNVDETRPKQVEGSSTDVYETVRQQSAEDKITPPLEQAASEGESNISSVVPKPHVPEETPMKPTEISQSGLEDGGTIEPALREENNKAEHENIKVSSISTQPEEPLPSQIAPIGQEKETVTVGLDIIPANVQEPSIQPVQKTGDIEKRVEVQPPIKQEDEQPEKEFCNASGMDRTKGLTEIESVVEAQIKVSDKSEIMDQESSVAKGIDVPEAFEQEQEDDKEEEPLGATTNKIFTEIEKMSKTRPNSLLIESRPYEDPMGILSTSEADLEAQMTRLVFCILSCRNSPAVLNPTDMAKQVEEAELCRQRAQQQVSSISKQAHINGEVSTLVTRSANDPEAMQRLSCRWTEALWDASGTVHTKEAQLQLVIDYDRQLQKARATLEKMVGELESLKMCPVESSFVEEQRLRSFLRTMEQERTVLGELIQTHSQLSPHLSQPERAAALSQQSVLQSEWMALERSAEKSLHKVSTYTKESFDLLEDINTLKEHLENCHKILESHWIPSSARDSKRVQETIGLGAELTAAKQRYFDIQENFEALSQSCNFKTEVYNIQQGLWSVKDHIDLIGEELEFSLPTSNNPSMVKIVKVITEAIAWAKKTQYDIENRERKVSLLPEEVHRQIKDLKMLNSDMTSKQIQLSTLTKEVTEMIPDLDRVDVPVVTSLLELLASLSKSTEERIAAAMEEIQLSLQTREKISEQITEVDSWIQSHLHKESLNREDFQSLSAADLDQRLRQSQDTLQEAEKHSGIAEALQMKSKDITSELSISENAWLYEKLSKLQEDIKGIINYEKSSILEIKDVLQNRELSEQKMSLLEQKLREMIIDMKGHTFPITKDSLDAIEPIKRILVEHKFQVEQINTSAEGRRRELLCVISELHHKMNTFRIKSQIHERFLSLKQRVEDLRENLELYVPKTKDESIGKEERYKICQSLLTQIPLIKLMYKEASDELLNISPDLYPSQLTTERERLKQNLETFNTWETAVQNNLRIVELDVLKDVNYLSEQRVVHSFLKEASQVLDKTCEVEFNQEAVDDELRKLLKLQKNVEARMRVLEVLEQKNGHQQRSRHSQSIAELAKSVLDQCDQRLTDLSKAKESLKNYFRGVRSASQFLQRTESVLLLSLCSPRSCSERLKDIQQALLSLDDEFQSRLTETQSFSPFSPLFSEQKVKQLQVEILGCLLVRMSTLKAQAQLRQEALERCVNSQRSTRVLYEELCRRVRDAETTLADCACKKITSQTDYLDQKETLKTLVKDVETLSGKLDELKEWCPVQGCRSNRDDAVNSLWGHVARLRRCTRDLLAHSAWRGEEWIRIKTSMEKASSVLERIEAAFPQSGREKATAEELSELLRFWSPYQDRLDCEHRALCALELRVVRLLRTERAEPVPLCQDLRTMQERYHSLKSRSAQGHKAAQAEMDERTKVREELRGIQEWLVSAGTLPSELERAPKAERLQVHEIGAEGEAKGISRPNVSAKWRKVITLPCIIHVFRNGDVLSPAMRFIIPRSLLKNLEQILSLVSEKAMLRTGAVRRLCTLDGVTVTSAEELESGQCYIAVGAERFKKLPYEELLLNKAPGGSADRHYVADRGLYRRLENRKFPQDSNSDSALLQSSERNGRRVKSTGDEAEPEREDASQRPPRRKAGGKEREERSDFYAKPARVHKHRPPHRAAPRGAASVFKGVGKRREEVQGAEEVAEDESTAVEIPVDQRVAEVVQDEELDQSQPESTNHMHQTGAPDERVTSSARSSVSPSNREHKVMEYGPSDGETLSRRRSSSPSGEVEEQYEDLLSEDLEHERGQDDKDEGPHQAEEPEMQDHTRPPSSSSQQRE